MSTFSWKKKKPGRPERIGSSSVSDSSPVESPLEPDAASEESPAFASASINADPEPLPNLSPTMRRYVEDKDFLESYLKRENRFLDEEAQKDSSESRGRTSSFKQPPGTDKYTVKRGDSLSKIALSCDIRNTELKRLNKLHSDMVYPGQMLYVPVVKKTEGWELISHAEVEEARKVESTSEKKEKPESTPERRKRVEAGALNPLRPTARSSAAFSPKRSSWTRSAMDDEEISDRFIRIRAKFITESQGVATGMMTVTAQCLMFNPSVLDPLVIDRGLDVYSLIIPIDSVASCAAYDDFAKLQQKDIPSYARSPGKGEGSFLLGSRQLQLALPSLKEDDENESGREKSEKSSSTPETKSVEEDGNSSEVERKQDSPSLQKKDAEKEETFVSNPEESEDAAEGADQLKDLPEKRKEPEEEAEDYDPVAASLKSRLSDAIEIPTVAMASLKKSEEIAIPRPSRGMSGSSRYFCVQLDGPLDASSHLTTSAIFIPSSVAVKDAEDAVKTAGVKVELWFAIAAERIDQLYTFLLKWCSNLQGMSYEQMKTLERDYVLLSLADIPKMQLDENHFGDGPIFNRDEEIEHNFSGLDVESSCPLPVLNGETSLVTEEYLQMLSESLPRRMISYDWHLIYSTFCHGISLKTLYRNSLSIRCPVILVVRDAGDHIFGAMLSDPFRVGEHFYGNGECSMFTLHPEYKHFPWSGQNHYCVKCNLDSFVVGGGEGIYGLWIDADIYHGSSHYCNTFNNEQLSSQRDFICTGLEVWGLY